MRMSGWQPGDNNFGFGNFGNANIGIGNAGPQHKFRRAHPQPGMSGLATVMETSAVVTRQRNIGPVRHGNVSFREQRQPPTSASGTP